MTINSTDQCVSVLVFQLFDSVIIVFHEQGYMIRAVKFHLFHGHELLVSGHLCAFDLSSDVVKISGLKFISDSLLVFLSVEDAGEEFDFRDCLERQFKECCEDTHLFESLNSFEEL